VTSRATIWRRNRKWRQYGIAGYYELVAIGAFLTINWRGVSVNQRSKQHQLVAAMTSGARLAKPWRETGVAIFLWREAA